MKNLKHLLPLLKLQMGGFLFAGSASGGSGFDKSDSTKGATDYWLLKTDKNGVKEWDKIYGGNSLEQLSTIIQTSDGGYLLGGRSASTISGDKTEDKRWVLSINYWVVKIDASGNKQWDKTLGSNKWDYLVAIVQTNDGGYVLGGYTNGTGYDISDSLSNNEDIWIVKINSAGAKEWDKCFGGVSRDFLGSMILCPDGGILLAGSTGSQIPNGNSDYWIIKISANGTKLWEKLYGEVVRMICRQ